MAQLGVTHRDVVASGSQNGAQTTATALAANSAREYFQIQNQSTATLYVYLGSGGSSSIYHFALKGCTGAADGTGGSYATATVAYRGIVTVASSSLSYSVVEL